MFALIRSDLVTTGLSFAKRQRRGQSLLGADFQETGPFIRRLQINHACFCSLHIKSELSSLRRWLPFAVEHFLNPVAENARHVIAHVLVLSDVSATAQIIAASATHLQQPMICAFDHPDFKVAGGEAFEY